MSGQCTYTRQSLLALPTHWHYHPIARELCAFVFDCVRTLVSIYVCVYVYVHLKTNYWLVKSSDSCACLYLHSHINFFLHVIVTYTTSLLIPVPSRSRFHGHGVLHFSNGGTFEADWENGRAIGQGTGVRGACSLLAASSQLTCTAW